MADLFQGDVLPSTVSTTQSQQTVPEFYTNYLQDIANLGQNAVTSGGVAGFGPLQQQAFQMAPDAAFSGASTVGSGAQLAGLSGTTSAPSIINNYMNPYTQTVVDEMGRLQQQNIQRNVIPALKAAGAATGGYGSSRMAGITGQTLADMQANLTGQQYGALSSGYKDAMTAAQADLTRQLQSGQTLGQLGTEQSQIGTTGLKSLTDLGGLQQAQGQKILDYPMTQAQNFAKLLQGYTIPAGSTSQTIAPGTQGQFTNSPLSQIAGLASIINSIYNTGNTTQSAQTNYYNQMTAKSRGWTANPDGTYTDPVSKTNYDVNLQPITTTAKTGGLISYNDGGSVSDQVMNDAANGNTLAFTQ